MESQQQLVPPLKFIQKESQFIKSNEQRQSVNSHTQSDNSAANEGNSVIGRGTMKKMDIALNLIPPDQSKPMIKPSTNKVRKLMKIMNREEVEEKKKDDVLDHKRYCLFFADDMVQKGIKTKGMLIDNQRFCKDDSQFQRNMEREGFFFNIDINPLSPMKSKLREFDMEPFSGEILDKQSQSTPQLKVEDKSSPRLESRGSSESVSLSELSQSMEQCSPYFLRNQTQQKVKVGKKQIGDIGDIDNDENRLDEILITSPDNIPIKKTLGTQKGSEIFDIQKEASYNMKAIQSFIADNYTCPTLKEIKSTMRKRDVKTFIDGIEKKAHGRQSILNVRYTDLLQVENENEVLPPIKLSAHSSTRLLSSRAPLGVESGNGVAKKSKDDLFKLNLNVFTKEDQDNDNSMEGDKNSTQGKNYQSFDKTYISGHMTSIKRTLTNNFSVIKEPYSALHKQNSMAIKGNKYPEVAKSSMNLNLITNEEDKKFNDLKSDKSQDTHSIESSISSDDKLRIQKSHFIQKHGIADRKLERQQKNISDSGQDLSIATQKISYSGFDQNFKWQESNINKLPRKPSINFQHSSNVRPQKSMMAGLPSFMGIKKLESEQPQTKNLQFQNEDHFKSKNLTSSKHEDTNKKEQSSMLRTSQMGQDSKNYKELIKKRKRDIKRLHDCTEENNEQDFVKNQEKKLIYLKEIAEVIKGQKITENCFKPEENMSRNNSTIGDVNSKFPITEQKTSEDYKQLVKDSLISVSDQDGTDKTKNKKPHVQIQRFDSMATLSINGHQNQSQFCLNIADGISQKQHSENSSNRHEELVQEMISVQSQNAQEFNRKSNPVNTLLRPQDTIKSNNMSLLAGLADLQRYQMNIINKSLEVQRQRDHENLISHIFGNQIEEEVKVREDQEEFSASRDGESDQNSLERDQAYPSDARFRISEQNNQEASNQANQRIQSQIINASTFGPGLLRSELQDVRFNLEEQKMNDNREENSQKKQLVLQNMEVELEKYQKRQSPQNKEGSAEKEERKLQITNFGFQQSETFPQRQSMTDPVAHEVQDSSLKVDDNHQFSAAGNPFSLANSSLNTEQKQTEGQNEENLIQFPSQQFMGYIQEMSPADIMQMQRLGSERQSDFSFMGSMMKKDVFSNRFTFKDSSNGRNGSFHNQLSPEKQLPFASGSSDPSSLKNNVLQSQTKDPLKITQSSLVGLSNFKQSLEMIDNEIDKKINRLSNIQEQRQRLVISKRSSSSSRDLSSTPILVIKQDSSIERRKSMSKVPMKIVEQNENALLSGQPSRQKSKHLDVLDRKLAPPVLIQQNYESSQKHSKSAVTTNRKISKYEMEFMMKNQRAMNQRGNQDSTSKSKNSNSKIKDESKLNRETVHSNNTPLKQEIYSKMEFSAMKSSLNQRLSKISEFSVPQSLMKTPKNQFIEHVKDDLDELQSIFSRRKSKSPTKSPSRKVTSTSLIVKKRDSQGSQSAKSAKRGHKMAKHFQPIDYSAMKFDMKSNFTSQQIHIGQQQKPEQYSYIYDLEKQVDASIFNGAESHLNEDDESTPFSQGNKAEVSFLQHQIDMNSSQKIVRKTSNVQKSKPLNKVVATNKHFNKTTTNSRVPLTDKKLVDLSAFSRDFLIREQSIDQSQNLSEKNVFELSVEVKEQQNTLASMQKKKPTAVYYERENRYSLVSDIIREKPDKQPFVRISSKDASGGTNSGKSSTIIPDFHTISTLIPKNTIKEDTLGEGQLDTENSPIVLNIVKLESSPDIKRPKTHNNFRDSFI